MTATQGVQGPSAAAVAIQQAKQAQAADQKPHPHQADKATAHGKPEAVQPPANPNLGSRLDIKA